MLNSNSEYLVKVLENVSDAIYTFDKDWRFTYLNVGMPPDPCTSFNVRKQMIN